MEYIHIKNLEKYNPGYKDRDLIWGKIYFTMVSGDPDCAMIEEEIDWSRLVKFILIELQTKKPIPINPIFLGKIGFNLKKRPIHLTLNALHKFVEVCNTSVTECNDMLPREEKRREDKSIKRGSTNGFVAPTEDEVRTYCSERNNDINPTTFIDFYASKGWMVGSNKMKDWKAAIRLWEQRDKDNPNKSGGLTNADRRSLGMAEK